MWLDAFRVQHYKKIRDTDWVSCRELTVFVGKNEAGKSAILRGLSKLNPSDGEKYDGLKEFPRRRYTDEFHTQDWPVTSGRFKLTDEERVELAAVCPLLEKVRRVTCTRHYSWRLDVEFEPVPQVPAATRAVFIECLDKAIAVVQNLVAPEGKGDAITAAKQNLLNALDGMKTAQEQRPGEELTPKAEVQQVVNAVSAQANEEWKKPLLEPVSVPLRAMLERVVTCEKLAQAEKWIGEHLPKFIYFDKFDVIESAIHLPTFVNQVGGNGGTPRVRTTHCLFKHVGLDIQKMVSLGRHQQGQDANADVRRHIDERAIHFSAASNAMTAKFTDWWEQRRHKFRYQVDGDYFRVWVSDDLDPSEIELDQRSAGMQYFFSFYLVFLVEAEGAHRNAILLLDEPGIHVHGTAQAKIVEFLQKLAKTNQSIYSTHSPFMVDADHLERARAVYEHADGTTRVSEDVWPRDRDSLFPLQAALGYQLAQSLFISKRQLIVEGLTDMWLVKSLSLALSAIDKMGLREDIVVVPSAGVSKLLPLASMLIGHDVEISALLDGDEPARKEGKKLVDKLLAGRDRRCLFIGDFLDGVPEAEIEDVFPAEFYLAAVKAAYPGVDLTFTPEEAAIPEIVCRVEKLFARRGLGRLEKWRPASVVRDRILEKPDGIPAATVAIMERVFAAVNAAFAEVEPKLPPIEKH